MTLGLSGLLTRATIRSPLTPLFLLAALAAGLVALLTIPREEEPQISVPMVDIVVQANGLKAPDAIELVTKPLEAIVKPIAGVEHVYSQTQDDRAVVTVRFNVGTKDLLGNNSFKVVVGSVKWYSSTRRGSRHA
jgi:multidrug efflux pump subunit AcrB